MDLRIKLKTNYNLIKEFRIKIRNQKQEYKLREWEPIIKKKLRLRL